MARILRPRGNKGEVAAVLLTDFAERLTKLKEIYVGNSDGKPEPRLLGLQGCWLSQNHRGQGVFHFSGINSINDAEQFRGQEVLLPLEQRVVLPAGQYFASDLIGCSVVTAGILLGSVSDIQFPGEEIRGTPLLEVQTSQGQILIPLATDICTRIDTVAQRIEVVLPEGLLDLDRDDA